MSMDLLVPWDWPFPLDWASAVLAAMLFFWLVVRLGGGRW